MFEQLNKKFRSTVREGIETENMEFCNISEFQGKTVPVDGFFFTEGDYGTQVVVVGKGKLINVPSRYVEDFTTIAQDEEMLNAVLAGKLALTEIVGIYSKKRKAYTTAFKFTEIL